MSEQNANTATSAASAHRRVEAADRIVYTRDQLYSLRTEFERFAASHSSQTKALFHAAQSGDFRASHTERQLNARVGAPGYIEREVFGLRSAQTRVAVAAGTRGGPREGGSDEWRGLAGQEQPEFDDPPAAPPQHFPSSDPSKFARRYDGDFSRDVMDSAPKIPQRFWDYRPLGGEQSGQQHPFCSIKLLVEQGLFEANEIELREPDTETWIPYTAAKALEERPAPPQLVMEKPRYAKPGTNRYKEAQLQAQAVAAAAPPTQHQHQAGTAESNSATASNATTAATTTTASVDATVKVIGSIAAPSVNPWTRQKSAAELLSGSGGNSAVAPAPTSSATAAAAVPLTTVSNGGSPNTSLTGALPPAAVLGGTSPLSNTSSAPHTVGQTKVQQGRPDRGLFPASPALQGTTQTHSGPQTPLASPAKVTPSGPTQPAMQLHSKDHDQSIVVVPSITLPVQPPPKAISSPSGSTVEPTSPIMSPSGDVILPTVKVAVPPPPDGPLRAQGESDQPQTSPPAKGKQQTSSSSSKAPKEDAPSLAAAVEVPIAVPPAPKSNPWKKEPAVPVVLSAAAAAGKANHHPTATATATSSVASTSEATVIHHKPSVNIVELMGGQKKPSKVIADSMPSIDEVLKGGVPPPKTKQSHQQPSIATASAMTSDENFWDTGKSAHVLEKKPQPASQAESQKSKVPSTTTSGPAEKKTQQPPPEQPPKAKTATTAASTTAPSTTASKPTTAPQANTQGSPLAADSLELALEVAVAASQSRRQRNEAKLRAPEVVAAKKAEPPALPKEEKAPATAEKGGEGVASPNSGIPLPKSKDRGSNVDEQKKGQSSQPKPKGTTDATAMDGHALPQPRSGGGLPKDQGETAHARESNKKHSPSDTSSASALPVPRSRNGGGEHNVRTNSAAYSGDDNDRSSSDDDDSDSTSSQSKDGNGDRKKKRNKRKKKNRNKRNKEKAAALAAALAEAEAKVKELEAAAKHKRATGGGGGKPQLPVEEVRLRTVDDIKSPAQLNRAAQQPQRVRIRKVDVEDDQPPAHAVIALRQNSASDSASKPTSPVKPSREELAENLPETNEAAREDEERRERRRRGRRNRGAGGGAGEANDASSPADAVPAPAAQAVQSATDPRRLTTQSQQRFRYDPSRCYSDEDAAEYRRPSTATGVGNNAASAPAAGNEEDEARRLRNRNRRDRRRGRDRAETAGEQPASQQGGARNAAPPEVPLPKSALAPNNNNGRNDEDESGERGGGRRRYRRRPPGVARPSDDVDH